MNCLSYRLFSSHHYKGIQRWALEEKTLLCFSFAKMALPDGTGAGKAACCTPISTQWPNRKMLGLERLSTSHKSASNITYSANVSQKCSACVLRTVQHAVSAHSLVRPPVQYSVLCMPWCITTPHHLHNTNDACLFSKFIKWKEQGCIVPPQPCGRVKRCCKTTCGGGGGGSTTYVYVLCRILE